MSKNVKNCCRTCAPIFIFSVAKIDLFFPSILALLFNSKSHFFSNSIFFLSFFDDFFQNVQVSVERIKEYRDDLEQEAPYEIPDQDPKDWPPFGEVKFDNYKTRYRPGLELVLKGVNADIKRGEKIGIVGRTGAGKSSMTLALFRIIEPAEGTISIDNIDITHMGVGHLRSRFV